ncbi:hypothetical protein GCM10010259_57840 [Streptomyces daghestanicus]|uniref:Uncharacterized protein n=1 Tax=Streptomyces daghestanicus TaxID=66885 RepID=A0ABQ3PU08_9ACTN|nr:hypothetical protein GCM10010259_57840 [Streptomyces daghestanicus]GHI28511.1 hypothetical protein Sdagh_02410 [Streptomyces daghestanicus]
MWSVVVSQSTTTRPGRPACPASAVATVVRVLIARPSVVGSRPRRGPHAHAMMLAPPGGRQGACATVRPYRLCRPVRSVAARDSRPVREGRRRAGIRRFPKAGIRLFFARLFEGPGGSVRTPAELSAGMRRAAVGNRPSG